MADPVTIVFCIDQGQAGEKAYLTLRKACQLSLCCANAAGLAENLALAQCHLVRADDQMGGVVVGDTRSLGQREPVDQGRWRLPRVCCLVDIRAAPGVGDAQAVKQLMTPAGAGSENEARHEGS